MALDLYQDEEEQDDDVMEIPLPKKLKRGAKSELKKLFPKLPNIRSSPTPLVNAIEMMNEAQKQAVKDLGFGSLLQLKITQCPFHIVDWVIKSFDYRDTSITLNKGQQLTIQPEDVVRIFGFPWGSIKIESKRWEKKTELRDEWYGAFKNRKKVGPAQLASKMLTETDGGRWFKIHFTLLVEACLIDQNKDGTVHSHIMHHMENIDEVKNLDWPTYLIQTLVERKSSYGTEKAWSGPALFLALYYVDRVNFKAAFVPRQFPIFLNWTTRSLKDREEEEMIEGGFGTGSPLDPIQIPMAYRKKGNLVTNPQTHKEELMKDATELVGKLIDFVRKLGESPVEEFGDNTLEDEMETGNKIIGYNTAQKQDEEDEEDGEEKDEKITIVKQENDKEEEEKKEEEEEENQEEDKEEEEKNLQEEKKEENAEEEEPEEDEEPKEEEEPEEEKEHEQEEDPEEDNDKQEEQNRFQFTEIFLYNDEIDEEHVLDKNNNNEAEHEAEVEQMQVEEQNDAEKEDKTDEPQENEEGEHSEKEGEESEEEEEESEEESNKQSTQYINPKEAVTTEESELAYYTCHNTIYTK